VTVWHTGVSIIEQAEKTELKEYLLGRLNDQDEERIGVRLMTDPAFAEEFDMTVAELTDQYVAGQFEGEERERIEQYFLRAEDRRARLQIALGLKQQRIKRGSWSLRVALPIAASFLIVAGVAYAVWSLTRESEFDKGLIALNSATQERRPVQARISGLNYAPFHQSRGAEDNPQQEKLRLAELHLKAALNDKPTAETHHALGRTYLAQGQFDEAITHLNQALAATQTNPRIYSDLGAAWLEKAKVSNQNTPTNGSAQATEEFNRSLENLNKALQLDNNLLEAIFNRALVHGSLKQTEQAKTDWREYLKRDSTSQWAAEASRNLQSLESPS